MPYQGEPLWINRFLVVGALLALFSVLLTLAYRSGQHPQARSGMIADITVNLTGKPVREHCTTCHPVAGGLPVPAGDISGTEHPDITPHQVELLGCTGCHLGEGMALDAVLSHGFPKSGARRILRGEEVQASCYVCHDLRLFEGAEKAWNGYELFTDRPCALCHRIATLGGGGYYGPDLSAIGSFLGISKISAAIQDPKKEPENSIMPRFPLSRRQITHLSYFLKSRVTNPNFTTPMLIQSGKIPAPACVLEPIKEQPITGEGLLTNKKCLGCHQFKDQDGYVAPDITSIGKARDPEYIRDFLSRPAYRIPGAIMPLPPMTDRERRILADFLETETLASLGVVDPKLVYMDSCQRCHAASGDGYGTIQPNLATFPRAFGGNREFFRRIGDGRIVKSLDQGIPGTSMPPFEELLTAPVRDGMIDLIFKSFIGVDRKDKTPLLPLPDLRRSSASEKGAEIPLFRKNCSRCHGFTGKGRGHEYLRYLPRPRNLTNHFYFTALEDDRIARAILDGVPGTAMAPFRDALSAQETWSLVLYIRGLSKTGFDNEKHGANHTQTMAP